MGGEGGGHDRYRDAESKKSKSLFHDQKRFEGRNSFRLFMNHRYKHVVINFATVNYERCSFYPMFLSLRFISVSPKDAGFKQAKRFRDKVRTKE